jgi:hypothetical protein
MTSEAGPFCVNCTHHCMYCVPVEGWPWEVDCGVEGQKIQWMGQVPGICVGMKGTETVRVLVREASQERFSDKTPH